MLVGRYTVAALANAKRRNRQKPQKADLICV
jgi:hypothetical protein